MIINKTIYPKTARVGADEIIITEKLNGANLVFMHTEEGRKLIATRNQMFDYPANISDLKLSYKGLYDWVQNHGHTLFDNIVCGAAICGEWMGENLKNYPEYKDTPFVMFANARVETQMSDDEFNEQINFKLNRFNYYPQTFYYAFKNEKVPYYIEDVPVISHYMNGEMPTIKILDKLYEHYNVIIKPKKLGWDLPHLDTAMPMIHPEIKAYVEGFIIHFRGTVSKYVRIKKGKLVEHDPLGRKQ